MSSRPQLSGEVVVDESVRLKREIAGLERELENSKEEARAAKQASADSVQAISALRRQLEPLYKSLKMIFGEISRVDADEVSASGASVAAAGSGLSPKWVMMKQKLGHREAQIIDALQHGGLTAKQLVPTLHWDIKTVYRFTKKMTDSNLLRNDNGTFSLKELS